MNVVEMVWRLSLAVGGPPFLLDSVDMGVELDQGWSSANVMRK